MGNKKVGGKSFYTCGQTETVRPSEQSSITVCGTSEWHNDDQ